MTSGPALRSTLVGVATGTPDGGVAVVRLSGPRAIAIATAACGDLPPPRALRQRKLRSGERALVVAMPGPGSFTGEDVVELHVHAGHRNVHAVVEALIEAGATAAGPGDFSRRAFELGRLTLDQAEGIAAVIGAQTDAALEQARRLAAGELGRDVQATAEAIGELRAEIEANLDFPEDVDPGDVARWRGEMAALAEAVAGWLSQFEAGRRARQRARIVLAGPANAGKSSLFNALLGRTRAIVDPQPGTTRDYVEATWELGPYGATLVDTAGLRRGGGRVERAGIGLSEDQMEGADVVVWIEAADAPALTEPLPAAAETTVIRLESKRDRGTSRPGWLGVSLGPHGEGPQEGLAALRDALTRWFEIGARGGAWIGLARHRARAQQAHEALTTALAELADAERLELAAFQLQVAQGRLGEITGRSALGPVGEDVLARIFSRFCIGK